MTKKRTVFVIFACIIAGIFTRLGWSIARHYFVLTWPDIVFAWYDSKHVELSRPETNEKYYNRWFCFDANNVKVSDAVIEYGTIRSVPLIDVKTSGNVFQFNVDPEVEWDTNAVQNLWHGLLEKQNSVCIFSVYSQTDDDGTEVRYIRKIRTRAGLWDKLDKSYQK